MASFNELVNKNSIVLIDFSAEWCGPCQTLAPILQDLKEECGDQLSILKIDIYKNQVLARNFAVQSVPTMILFKDGSQVWRKSGLLTKGEILNIVNHFSNSK